MLLSLHLKNLAIVDSADLDFKPGMTAITGETGVGKSILIDGLSLVLGGRADSGMVGTGGDRAEIIAEFILTNAKEANAWLRERSLDSGEQSVLIRRVLSSEGRSRNFINGTAVTVGELKNLAAFLVDIHAQHEHHQLGQRTEQLAIFDAFAIVEQEVSDLRLCYGRWRAVQAEIETLESTSAARLKEQQLLDYQLNEFDALALTDGEYLTLTEQHQQLSHADETQQILGRQIRQLVQAEESVTDQLRKSVSALTEIKDQNVVALVAPIESALIQIEETAKDLQRYGEGIENQPELLSQIESRIERVVDLARKHHCKPEDLHLTWESLRTQRAELVQADESLDSLSAELANIQLEWQTLANSISAKRRETTHSFETLINGHLRALGMQEARLQVLLAPLEEMSPTGLETLEFQISTNKGQPFGPIHKIASGGELSRISLAIQVARIRDEARRTLIFDEVDVGIGGSVAETVGQLLAALGQQHQILCVTHLGQVAAQADHHLKVLKSGDPVSTSISTLTDDAPIEEIARMAGGAAVTDASRALAKEMLSDRLKRQPANS